MEPPIATWIENHLKLGVKDWLVEELPEGKRKLGVL
jgi:hypothetical protein